MNRTHHVSPRTFTFVLIAAALFAGGCGTAAKHGSAMKDSGSMKGKDADSMKGKDSGSMKDSGEMMGAMGEPNADPRMLRNQEIKVSVADSKYGQILYDQNGLGLYLFQADTSSDSTCYGECAVAWPPVLLSGDATAGSGASSDRLGTTKRKDGATQLTYNGHPIYYFKGDRDHKIFCQNVNEHGGLWLLVDAHGDAVTSPHAA